MPTLVGQHVRYDTPKPGGVSSVAESRRQSADDHGAGPQTWTSVMRAVVAGFEGSTPHRQVAVVIPAIKRAPPRRNAPSAGLIGSALSRPLAPAARPRHSAPHVCRWMCGWPLSKPTVF